MKNQIFRALFLLLVLTLAACGNEISPFLEETKSASQTSTATQIVFDATYDIGIIVITQYYTFLGHGLHEEAYWLQSTPHREIYSVEEYVDRMKPNFRNVEIITIQPLNKWLADQEQPTVPDPPPARNGFMCASKLGGRATCPAP